MKTNIIAGLLTLGVIAGGLYLWFGAQLTHGFTQLLIQSAFIWFPILVGILIFIVLVLALKPEQDIADGIAGIVCLFVAFGMMFIFFTLPYGNAQHYLGSGDTRTETVNVSQADLQYRERAAYSVAQNASTRYLGASTGDVTGVVKSLPSVGEHGVYNTTIKRRGFAQGYESTQSLVAPIIGSTNASDVKFCEFDYERAGHKLGGFFPWNNLKAKVLAHVPLNVNFRGGDAFVVCEEGTPFVVMPAYATEGFISTYQKPWGTLVYNGKTGEVTATQDPSELPFTQVVPLYPQSIAQTQRSAIKADGNYWDVLFGKVGLEDTASDDGNPDLANMNEVTLSSPDAKQSFYVSPLTPRGSSSTIVAISEVEASTYTPGKFNQLKIKHFPAGEEREANTSIAQKIMTTKLEGYKGQGLSVFEIVPASDGVWVASIGKEQVIKYRAYIDTKGNIKLVSEIGDESDTPQEIKTKINIKDMTSEEISNTISQLVKELESRVQKG